MQNKVTKDSSVSIQYILKDKHGEIIDQSGSDGFTFKLGQNEVIIGLEDAMIGKAAGESFSVDLGPKEAYGERNESLVQKISLDKFDPEQRKEVKPGAQFEIETEVGPLVVFVDSLDKKEVTLDGNHPLSGETLHFEVTIISVEE